MEYKLKINKPKLKPSDGDVILYVTDIQGHTNNMESSSIGKSVRRSIENNEPGRIYFPINKGEDNKSYLDRVFEDPSFMKLVQEYNIQGKQVFIARPKVGVPLFAGQDTEEFINSKNGKRVLRGLEKNRSED